MDPQLEAEVQQALDQVASSDVPARRSGASALVDLACEPGAGGTLIAHLVLLLSDRDPELRAAACAGLRACAPRDELAAHVEPLLRDPAAPVRREATRTLASLERASVAPQLRAALQDADAQVGFEAATGLAALRDGSGVEILLAAVDDSVRRFAALGALAQLGEARARPAAEAILSKFFVSDFDRTQAAGVLAKLNVEAGRERLLSRLDRARAEDRGLAMELCGEHRVLAAIPALRRCLHDANDPFRGTAARSLGLLGEDPSGATLDRLASDVHEDFDVRCDAMEGLMFLGTSGALTALRRLAAEGEIPAVRSAAEDALAWLASAAPDRVP